MLRKEEATPEPSQLLTRSLARSLLLPGGTGMCRVGSREARQSRLGVQRVKGAGGWKGILQQYPGHQRAEGYPERIRGGGRLMEGKQGVVAVHRQVGGEPRPLQSSIDHPRPAGGIKRHKAFRLYLLGNREPLKV